MSLYVLSAVGRIIGQKNVRFIFGKLMSLGNSKSVLGDLTDITVSRKPCIAFTFCISLTYTPKTNSQFCLHEAFVYVETTK